MTQTAAYGKRICFLSRRSAEIGKGMARNVGPLRVRFARLAIAHTAAALAGTEIDTRVGGKPAIEPCCSSAGKAARPPACSLTAVVGKEFVLRTVHDRELRGLRASLQLQVLAPDSRCAGEDVTGSK